MGFLSNLLKTGLVLGAVYTAWQASETTKKQTGSYDQETFVRNFKDQAIENSKLVVDAVKSRITGKRSTSNSIGPKRTELARAIRSASFSSTPRHFLTCSRARSFLFFGTSGQSAAPSIRPIHSQQPRGRRQHTQLRTFSR